MKNRNKWSEIAKFLSGRSENAVKNRFNILLKRYKQEAAAGKVTELDKALQAITEPIKDDLEWIRNLIQKREQPPADDGFSYSCCSSCCGYQFDLILWNSSCLLRPIR
jgi:hypothetical protein